MIDLILSRKNPVIEKGNKDRKILFAAYFDKEINFEEIDAVIIQTSDLNDLNSKIAKISARKKIVIVEGNTDLINRKALENKNVFMLLSPEKIRKQDSINFKNSGLIQVLCEIARKNSKIIGINLAEILNEGGEMKPDIEKAKITGRIMQNVKLCRKYKCKIILLSCSEKPIPLEIIKNTAFLLGFSTSQIKEMGKFIV